MSIRLLALGIVLITSSAWALVIPARPQNVIREVYFNNQTPRDFGFRQSTVTFIGNTFFVRDPGGYAINFGTKPYFYSGDGAVYLTGTNGVRVEFPPSSDLNFNTGNFTIFVALSMDVIAANQPFMTFAKANACAGCGGLCGWAIWQNTGPKLAFANCGAGANPAPAKANIYDNQFVHGYFFRRSGAVLSFFTDGELIGTDATGGNFGDACPAGLCPPLIIGDPAGVNGAGEYTGKIAAIVIWNTDLSNEEITATWNSRNTTGTMME